MKATRFRAREPKICDIKLKRTKVAVAVDDNVVNDEVKKLFPRRYSVLLLRNMLKLNVMLNCFQPLWVKLITRSYIILLILINIKKMLSTNRLLFGVNANQRSLLRCQPSRPFGIMQEYNERKNKKLTNNLLTTDRNMYWVTSSRPSNFGDPLDAKTKVDNWFDENR